VRKLLLVTLYSVLLFFYKNAFAQKEEVPSVSNIVKLNFLMPGISYEQRIAKYKTIYFGAYLNAFISSKKYYTQTQSELNFGPTLDIEFRNYYNLKRRFRNNLRTVRNSANYIAPIYNGTYIKTSSIPDARLISQIGAVWGMQRNYPKRFSLDFNVGLGYIFNNIGATNNNTIWPIAQVSLGFWLN
jgi:hypothetical protein